MAEHGITFPNKEEWRLTDRIVGEIHALPSSYGILTATNGMLCYIEQENGKMFGPAHIAFFVARKPEQQQVIKSLCQHHQTPSASRKTPVDISDLI